MMMSFTFGSGATIKYREQPKWRVKQTQNVNPDPAPLPNSCAGEEKLRPHRSVGSPSPSPAHHFDYQAFGLSKIQYRLYCAILERRYRRGRDG